MTDFNLYSYINYDKTTSYFASLLMSGNINYLYYEIDIENHKIKKINNLIESINPLELKKINPNEEIFGVLQQMFFEEYKKISLNDLFERDTLGSGREEWKTAVHAFHHSLPFRALQIVQPAE